MTGLQQSSGEWVVVCVGTRERGRDAGTLGGPQTLTRFFSQIRDQKLGEIKQLHEMSSAVQQQQVSQKRGRASTMSVLRFHSKSASH